MAGLYEVQLVEWNSMEFQIHSYSELRAESKMVIPDEMRNVEHRN